MFFNHFYRAASVSGIAWYVGSLSGKSVPYWMFAVIANYLVNYEHAPRANELRGPKGFTPLASTCLLALTINQCTNFINFDNAMFISGITFELGGQLAEYFGVAENIAALPNQFMNYCQNMIFGDGDEDEFEETPDSFGMYSIVG